MAFLQVQVVATAEKQSKPLAFSADDLMELMGYGVVEEGKLVVHGKVKNVEGGGIARCHNIRRLCVFRSAEERGRRICPLQECGNG